MSESCCGPTSLKPADVSLLPQHSFDEAPATHAVTMLQRASAREAADALIELLQQLDARQEALIERLEERVQQMVSERLDKMTDTFFKAQMSEAPHKTMRSKKVHPNASTKSDVEDAECAEEIVTQETSASDNAQRVPQETKPRTELSKSQSALKTSQTLQSIVECAESCELEIVSAEGLYASDIQLTCCNSIPSSDPYVKVLLGEDRKEVYKTNVQKKTLNPTWNAFCKFKVAPGEDEVVIELWDEDQLDKDDLLGRVTFNLTDIQSAGGIVTQWIDITPQEDCPGACGKVLLKATVPNSKNFKAREATTYFNLLGADGSVQEDMVKQDNQHRFPLLAKLKDLVSSAAFDGLFVGCIVLNAIGMVLELEYYGRKLRSEIGLDDPGSNTSPAWESVFEVLNFVFAITFMVELCLRLAAFGYKFLTQIANWLDIIVVLSSLLEVLDMGSLVDLTFLRLVRLTKLARLLRIMLLASFCNPLRILLKAIYTGFGSLFWSFVLLMLIEVIAALFLTQLLADSIMDESIGLERRRFIYTYYGTTSRTTLTMFQITMAPGAWGLIGRPIIEDVSPHYAWFFVLYVGGVSFAIIRIITALFLRQTLQVAASDEQLMKNEKIKSQRKYSESVRELFDQADTSGTGQVTFEQFQSLMADEHIRTWFQILEINPKNASYIFELVDNGDGRLTLDEFLTGVFRLKGQAQQIDMVMLQRETRIIKDMMKQLWDSKFGTSTALKRSSTLVAPSDLGSEVTFG